MPRKKRQAPVIARAARPADSLGLTDMAYAILKYKLGGSSSATDPPSGQTQGLDEMIARRTRQATATWGKDYLENPSTYVWQPETLCYTDTVTNHEVWILMRTPDELTLTSSEYACNLWSYDGSRVTAWIHKDARTTANPATCGSNITYRRWIVKSDGTYLKVCEGPGIGGLGEEPNWANTENAYFYQGAHLTSLSQDGGYSYILYKCSVGDTNIITSTPYINLKTITGGSDDHSYVAFAPRLIKRAITNDDLHMIVRDASEIDRGRTINCIGLARIAMGASPSIETYWGINRDCYEYDSHLKANELKYHGGGCWRQGSNAEYADVLYEGSEYIFFRMAMAGSDGVDGGPVWEDWDGDSYGANEIYPLSSSVSRTPTPDGTYQQYWNHPQIDRWDQYILLGGGDPYEGTQVYSLDVSAGIVTWNGTGADSGYVDEGITPVKGDRADGRHHSWNAWADHVVFFPWKISGTVNNYRIMYGSKMNWATGVATPYQICMTIDDTDTAPALWAYYYNSLMRPSQSPDGTKVLFSHVWLNNASKTYVTGFDAAAVAYGVAYYPYPGEITGATNFGASVRLAFTPGLYTTRTYGGNAVEPKEIKYWHVWGSDNGTTGWTELTTTTVAFATRIYDYAQTPSTTKYYTVTAEEHSRLESRRIGNVWKVTVDADSLITESVEQTDYPTDPGSTSDFWTTDPSVVTGLSVTTQAVPGHYVLNWTEPTDLKVRYYNIYYAASGNPSVSQNRRIASLPVGTSSWRDWNANTAASHHYYGVTTVDRQGNESAAVYASV